MNICSKNSKLYVTYLRKKGVSVGEGTTFFGHVSIDVTRPSLVEIGRNCMFTDNVSLLTHGFDWSVLREKYGEILCSSGKVVVEDNVFVGTKTIILKGVKIGRDSIIGAGSVITHDIPAGSVAAGNPCNVIMTIDQYYQNRKKKYVDEAKTYAYELFLKTGKIPQQEDFWEEFPIFLKEMVSGENYLSGAKLGPRLPIFLNPNPFIRPLKSFLLTLAFQKIRSKKKVDRSKE